MQSKPSDNPLPTKLPFRETTLETQLRSHRALRRAQVIEWPESDFRGDYARLGELREALPGLPMLALSATPTPSMWQSIRDPNEDTLRSFRAFFSRPFLVIAGRAGSTLRTSSSFYAEERGASHDI